ncbi:MAG TPA: PHP domain-containing protein [Dehalococcoidia bacterium]|nr:PHP domain-containing protein [Dehalococcoidia bacterium]
MRIDLHVHTTAGSADSALKASRLAAHAREAGLDAVAITEHFRVWDAFEAQQARAEGGLPVLRGVEWNTDHGHVLVFGIERYESGVRRLEELRELVTAAGGFMIIAHPFRHFFDPPPARRWLAGEGPATMSAADCARLPVFRLVDEIEVWNGNCTARENAFAAEVAALLGRRGTGGSDAHYGEDLGRCHTVFERAIDCEAALIAELRAGRFRAVGPQPES